MSIEWLQLAHWKGKAHTAPAFIVEAENQRQLPERLLPYESLRCQKVQAFVFACFFRWIPVYYNI